MDIAQRAGQRPAPHVVAALAATGHSHIRLTPRRGPEHCRRANGRSHGQARRAGRPLALFKILLLTVLNVFKRDGIAAYEGMWLCQGLRGK